LRGAVKKAQLQRILDELSEEKELICKSYTSKLYLASQKNFPQIDEEEDKKLNADIDQAKERVTELKEIKDKLLAGILVK
jgi:hypothetical protein